MAALSNPPVVTSALDALRAFVRHQPVAFPQAVADQLTRWGFTVSPLTAGVSPIDPGRAALAADILSGVGRDFTLNNPDPIQTAHDDQPDVRVPDLTVFITGPLSGQPGDGTLVLVSRLNPDGTPAFSNPAGVAQRVFYPTVQTAGLAGFGQADLGPQPARGGVVMATMPLATADMQDLGVSVTAGEVVAFSGTMAGQVLAKVPFIGGAVSAAYSGAEMMERPTPANIVQFFVDVATGGGGLAGQIARVAIPGLGTAQAIADFAAGDARSIMQGIATLLTAPVAILYGPLGAAAQGAARWLAGKAYDWFHERDVNAAIDQAFAERRAADLRLADQLGMLSPEEYADYQAGQQAAQTAADIRNYAAETAAWSGSMPDVQTVADALGVDPALVADALGLPPVEGEATTSLELTPAEDVPVNEALADVPVDTVPVEGPVDEGGVPEVVPDYMLPDVTGQPVLPVVTEPPVDPCPVLDPTAGHSSCNWGPMDACGVCASQSHVIVNGKWVPK